MIDGRRSDGADVSRRSQLKNRGRARSGEPGWTSGGASSDTAGGGMGHASSRTTRGDIGRVISGCEHGGQEGNNEMRITYVDPVYYVLNATDPMCYKI